MTPLSCSGLRSDTERESELLQELKQEWTEVSESIFKEVVGEYHPNTQFSSKQLTRRQETFHLLVCLTPVDLHPIQNTPELTMIFPLLPPGERSKITLLQGWDRADVSRKSENNQPVKTIKNVKHSTIWGQQSTC